MNIQSLSIMVPCGGHCMNNCKFCVSRMRDDESIFGKEIISATNIPQSYIDRIKYIRDTGCDNMIITGTQVEKRYFNKKDDNVLSVLMLDNNDETQRIWYKAYITEDTRYYDELEENGTK